ncbi:hypothetical protein SKAU_G00254550 [Synaphobranchus kaupii]|uniref:AF4/FMR2 C-terminal homology domain-containing protein n=1 Tax=Synaphobranchus kaupii TaxID=118154 RepID=A0A9Q1F3H9_SYNKA|nr:hypothetical protein SKAU_G00254550 [Synaphobranchus kaupii]
MEKNTEDSKPLKRRPDNSAFKQQRLPAWSPSLAAGTVLPFFFFMGVLCVLLGVGLLLTVQATHEIKVDYTNAGTCETCFNLRKSSINALQSCDCNINFTLSKAFKGDVFLYYGLVNFHQNLRRYMDSRDDGQMVGRLKNLKTPSSYCSPFSHAGKAPIAPCGAIANSMFNDSFVLHYHPTEGESVPLPMFRRGIAWYTDRNVKFRNPKEPNKTLVEVFEGTVPPFYWQKPVYELDQSDPGNTGFINEDLIVWMREAAFPNFKKLYGILDQSQARFEEGLPAGNYSVSISYNYPVEYFQGRKMVVLSTVSWFGGQNHFLPIAYMVTGGLILVVAMVLTVVYLKVGKRGLYQTHSETLPGLGSFDGTVHCCAVIQLSCAVRQLNCAVRQLSCTVRQLNCAVYQLSYAVHLLNCAVYQLNCAVYQLSYASCSCVYRGRGGERKRVTPGNAPLDPNFIMAERALWRAEQSRVRCLCMLPVRRVRCCVCCRALEWMREQCGVTGPQAARAVISRFLPRQTPTASLFTGPPPRLKGSHGISIEVKTHSSYHTEFRRDIRPEDDPPKGSASQIAYTSLLIGMLVDDLHLSSDEDNITEPHETTWATRDSSNSGSTSSSSSTSSTRSNSSSSPSRSFNDSDSNSQHSCSPSPDMHPDPGPSATTWPLTCSMEEPEQPSPTQWHLNRWLNKVRKRQASGDQEQSVDAEPLSNLDSDSIQSPGGTWRRDHSPVQRDGHSPHYSPAPSPNFNYSARKPSTVIKETEVDGQKRPPVSQRKEVPINLWIRESEEEDDKGKERKEKRRKEKEERRKEKEERKKEKKGKKEKGKESGKMHEAEAPAVQPKLRLQTNTQRPQKPTDYERERKKKKRRKTEETSTLTLSPQPISTTATKVLADSTSGQRLSTRDQQNRAGRPRRAQLKSGRPSLADSTSGQRTSSRGQQSRAGRPRTAQLNLVRPSCWAEETPVEKRGGQGRHKLYTLVPFGRSGGAPGLGHSPPAQYARARSLRSLRVRIDLTLLPGPPEATTRPSRARSSSSTSSSSSLKKARRRGGAKRLCSPQSDHKRRRKYEESDLWKDGKQSHPPRDPPLDWKASTVRAPTETHTDTRLNRCKEDRPANKRKTLSPLSPLTDTPECLKKGEVPHPPGKARMERMEDAPVQNTQPEMPMGRQQGPLQSVCEYRGTPPPQTTSHRQGPSIRDIALQVERYMLEAKRLKHRADSMVDRFGKVLNYVDAALSFMECGKAVEEGPLGAKSPYSMYAETVELIRYALRLKKYQGSKASNEDKQLAVLCFRCLALLYWRMFRLKKDHAIKCSNTLLEYFKSTPNSFLTPPPRSTLGKDSGAPSSTNPLSSPLCSPSSSISIPQHVHQMAADHLEITNSVLYSYEYWEVADNLAKECKEFFSYLNSLMGPLTLQSSMAHIVRYTRQGLQWIRASVQLT